MRIPLLALLLSLTDVAPEALSFLAGCWSGEVRGARYEESWTSAEGGVLLGTSRTIRDGRVVEWEFLRIARQDGRWTYLAQPGGRPATAFPLAGAGARTLTFENLAHDFPQRIVYTRAGDRLTARVEGGGRTLDVPMTRRSCPAD